MARLALPSARTSVPSARTLVSSRGSLPSARRLGANLEVPIEMVVCQTCSASGSALTYEATKTGIDTKNYNGVTGWYWEINAQNGNVSNNYTVYLINSAGTTVASQVVNANTTVTRFRQAITPTVGYDVYRIKFDQTAANNDLRVNNSRIIVQQNGATKTRIQIPLGGSASTANSDNAANIDSTVVTTYFQQTQDRYNLQLWDSSVWATVTGLTFSAVLSNSGGAATTSASLFDATANSQVVASEITNVGSTITLVSKDITTADLTSGHEYEVRFKTTTGQTGRLHKSFLYIQLSAVAGTRFKGESHYVVGREAALTGATTNAIYRVLYDASVFTNPVVYHESTARESTAGSTSSTTNLQDYSTSDGTTAPSTAVGSTNTYTAVSARTRKRAGPVTVTSGNRYGVGTTQSTGGTMVRGNRDFIVAWSA